MSTPYLGIDYGLGTANIDKATGIRYGVISQHSMADWFFDEFQAVYPELEDDEDAYNDVEPIGFELDSDGIKAIDCLDSDVMIVVSPFYTFAQFCSPCVPGAGNLNTPMEDGIKAYCFPHDWFNDGKAPYRVFRVSDDTEVLPE